MQLPKYKLNQKSSKKDFIFNMFGSTAMSFVSVLLLVVVSHIKGEDTAGIFSLAYSTAQMMYTVAMFETRTVQVTDTQHIFSYSDIAMYRIFTVLIMLVSSAVFVICKGFSTQKIILSLMLCVYMALLSVSDTLQGNLHLNGYLKNAGFSLGSQVLLAATGFVAVLTLTSKSRYTLYFAILAMIVTVALWIVFYDIPFANNFGPLKPRFEFKKQKQLLSLTLPLFVSVFLNQYNLNTPKYAIERYLTDVDQSHYGYLVMPAFIINLMSLFVFRPQLVPLSEKWHNNNFKGFYRTILMLYGWIAGVSVAALAGGWLLGIPVLNILYKTNLNDCRTLFEILLIGGGFGAGSSLTIVLLAVIKKQKYGLSAYIFSFAIAMFVPNLLVKTYGFAGAVYSYLTVTASLFVSLFTVFIICLNTARRQKEKQKSV